MMIINDDENINKSHNACLSTHNLRQAKCSQHKDKATPARCFSYLKYSKI